MAKAKNENLCTTRWQKADENFRKQIKMLMIAMNTNDKRDIAREAGLSPFIIYSRFETPSKLCKIEERQLASVFERYGLQYDPTLGEGCYEH